MKTHETLKVTADWLRLEGACYDAIVELNQAGILPCKLSTDPEDNIDIAIELYEAGLHYHLWWLLGVADAKHAQQGDGYALDYADATYERMNDGDIPWLAAQAMAIFADRFLTAEGR